MPGSITDCRYSDARRAVVLCRIDGEPASVPCDPENRHWQAIVEHGIPIAEPE